MSKAKALTVHFDEDGKFISSEYPDGRVYTYPVASFYDTPLRNINLLRVETYDILVYDEPDENGNMVRRVGTHWQCRRYC
jgi:hypothetical protein